ncbi:tripartite tricarboxylate transporter TctB family protein [Roseovarius nanhaiticus]|uniref:tripartite tricarboxylate transporter TctB family protein n=1 Tax=Roseovarius nanhaiticus TaxID=573024 RepID=UPI00248F9ECB|nr:tripartite tricarboxylate transporter TctB family protein [Roseovarius nanhaiticus]
MERRQDTILGAVFAALGIFAAVKAAEYSGATGLYPMILGLVMAALGALVAGKAWLRDRNNARPLTEHTGRAALTVVLGAVYIALVPLLGFYTASALAVVFLPAALGFRQPVYLALAALIFTLVVWAVFSVLLEKPLPDEFWMAD